MKIIFNNNAVRRVFSYTGSCGGCVFKNNTSSCIPELMEFCTTKNICYTLYLGGSIDLIFLI